MRIAVNTRFLLAGKLEGIGRFSHEILSRMVRNHPEHEFIFFFDRPYDEQFVYAPNVIPVVLHPPARHPFLYLIWFEFAVSRALKKYKADVFLSVDGYNCLSTSVPSVVVIHDIAFKHIENAMNRVGMAYHNYFFPRFVAAANRVATVSEYTKQDLVNTFGADAKKMDVVYNAPATGFNPVDENTQKEIRGRYTFGKPYFLYVGAMHPRKNIKNLLRAYDNYATTAKQPMPLLIVGRKAWSTSEIEVAYNNMQYKDHVIFTGRVAEHDLHLITAAAFAMVYVPFYEGFGLPIVESMSCGVPVITSNVTSMPEVAGDAALLVSPAQHESITEAMIKLANDQELYNNLKKRASERSKYFSWDNSANKLWDCILKAIS